MYIDKRGQILSNSVATSPLAWLRVVLPVSSAVISGGILLPFTQSILAYSRMSTGTE
ncbi:hypothetical protein BJX65DRAFT_263590 [Aspergillus insuetus]